MSEKCRKCGEEVDIKTRMLTVEVDKKTGGTKRIVVCFECFKKEKARTMKFLSYSGIVIILLGVFTFVSADQLVFYAGLPELYGIPRTHDAYWTTGIILSIIGVTIIAIGYRRYHSILKIKSKSELM